jgi:hypothetical protein
MDSSVLSALLTDGALSERLLGGNVWYSGTARIFVCASSNNSSLSRDLSRRLVRVRLDPGVERPNGLSFPFDPVDLAVSERMKIARAVLIVIRAYFIAGAPQGGAGSAGFGQWNRLIRQCVIFVGESGLAAEAGIGTLGDPAHSIVEQAGADDASTTAHRLLLCGARLVLDAIFTARDLLHVYTAAEHVTDPDDDRGLIRDGLGAMLGGRREVSAVSVGRALAFLRDRIVGGLVLRQCGQDRNGIAQWRVETV